MDEAAGEGGEEEEAVAEAEVGAEVEAAAGEAKLGPAAGTSRAIEHRRTRTRRVGRTTTAREGTTRRWRVLEGRARSVTRCALLSHYDIDILDTTWMKLLGSE